MRPGDLGSLKLSQQPLSPRGFARNGVRGLLERDPGALGRAEHGIKRILYDERAFGR